MKYVSYSLWGDKELYTEGAVINARQVNEFYPGWTGIFYHDSTVPTEIIQRIKDEGGITVDMTGIPFGPFWRFFSSDLSDCEYTIFRDCDSRLSEREVSAVNEWISSNKSLHVMRDHPAHRIPFGNDSIGILAGMWGIKGNLVPLTQMINKFCDGKTFSYGLDQTFLKTIYRIFSEDKLEHDDLFQGKPYPTKRTDYRFIGERINPDGTPTTNDWMVLQNYYQL